MFTYTDEAGNARQFKTWQEAAKAQFDNGGKGKVEGPPVAPPTPLEVAKAAAQVAQGSQRPAAAPPAVSATEAQRAETRDEQVRHLSRLGFTYSEDTFYPPGTPVIPAGKEKYKQSFQKWAEMPPIEEVIQIGIDKIRSEGRVDKVVDLRDLRMREDGCISRDGRNWVPLEERAFDQLVTRISAAFNDGEGEEDPKNPRPKVFYRAAAHLGSLPPDERCDFFNREMARFKRDWRPTKRVKDPLSKFRFRKTEGGPALFAALGKDYAVVDGDQLLAALKERIEGQGYRGTLLYDRETTRLKVDGFLHAPKELDVRVDDIFQVGWQARGNDQGGGSVVVDFNALRVRCINLTTISAYMNALRRAHRGKSDEILSDFNGAVADIENAYSLFAEDWGILRKTPVDKIKIWGATYEDVPSALDALVRQGKIAKSIGDKVAVEAMLTGWRNEPGNTLADLINAVTRAAWQSDFDQLEREQLEREAGDLIPVLARYSRNA